MSTKLEPHHYRTWIIIQRAIKSAFLKLTPKHQLRNPVMFTVYVSSILTTVLFFQSLIGLGETSATFAFFITFFLGTVPKVSILAVM